MTLSTDHPSSTVCIRISKKPIWSQRHDCRPKGIFFVVKKSTATTTLCHLLRVWPITFIPGGFFLQMRGPSKLPLLNFGCFYKILMTKTEQPFLDTIDNLGLPLDILDRAGHIARSSPRARARARTSNFWDDM